MMKTNDHTLTFMSFIHKLKESSETGSRAMCVVFSFGFWIQVGHGRELCLSFPVALLVALSEWKKNLFHYGPPLVSSGLTGERVVLQT